MKACAVALGIALTLMGVSAPAQVRAKAKLLGRPQVARQPKWRIPAEVAPALKTALGAVGKIHYSGSRIVEAKAGPDRQRHVEYVVTDGVHSRIEFPADSPFHGQVIVEGPNERRHYLPGPNQIQVLPPQRDEAFVRIVNQVNNRKFASAESPGGTIAGFPTELVTISDRQGNVLQKLWIEPHSGMILKREMYNRSGGLQASFEFTQANLHPIVHPSDFVIQIKGASLITPNDVLNRIVRKQGYQNVRIPPGTPYRLERARLQKIADQQVLVQQYAGNGHRITLYQLKSSVDPKRLGLLERPDLQIYSWQSNGSSFVLVGDLSDGELNELGRRLGG